MPTEALDDIDLVKGTLRNLGRMKVQQIAQSLTDYEVFPRWFKKDRVIIESGVGIQRSLLARLPGIARHVGWTDEDQYSIVDLVEQLQIPWRHANVSWMWKRQEILMNSGPEKIFDLVKERRRAAMIDMVEVFEAAGWNAPSASTNKTDPFGMAYWIVQNATTGYNGGIPTGHTTMAGLDLVSDAVNFKNYTTTYSTFDQANFVAKLRTMKRKTGFKSPVPGNDYSNSSKRNRYRVYMNEPTISAMELNLLAQNDNLGTKDISNTDDGPVFKGHPIVYVPFLDAQTNNPVYFVDHETFYPVILKGDFMREDDPIRDTSGNGRHDWRVVHVDTTYNFLCVDRRRNGVMYQA